MRVAIHTLARALAVVGGIVLVALIVVTCISILGRIGNTILHSSFMMGNFEAFSKSLIEMGVGPVKGDFELVEAGVAFSILAFFPWCQLMNGHATVDIFTAVLGTKANRFLIALWEWLFALVMIVITWRMYVGMSDKMRYGETTFLLEFPVWWGFAICVVAAGIAALVAVYVAAMRTGELMTGRSWLFAPDKAGDRGAEGTAGAGH